MAGREEMKREVDGEVAAIRTGTASVQRHVAMSKILRSKRDRREAGELTNTSTPSSRMRL